MRDVVSEVVGGVLLICAGILIGWGLSGCDCAASHPREIDSGVCGEGLVLCEGNCVPPEHPICESDGGP